MHNGESNQTDFALGNSSASAAKFWATDISLLYWWPSTAWQQQVPSVVHLDSLFGSRYGGSLCPWLPLKT